MLKNNYIALTEHQAKNDITTHTFVCSEVIKDAEVKGSGKYFNGGGHSKTETIFTYRIKGQDGSFYSFQSNTSSININTEDVISVVMYKRPNSNGCHQVISFINKTSKSYSAVTANRGLSFKDHLICIGMYFVWGIGIPVHIYLVIKTKPLKRGFKELVDLHEQIGFYYDEHKKQFLPS